MDVCQNIAAVALKLNVQGRLGERSRDFLCEIAHGNFVRGKVIMVTALGIFVALLGLDINRLFVGTPSDRLGHWVLFWGHCSMMVILGAALLLAWRNPARHADQIKPFHVVFLNTTIFLVLLNMVLISIGDIFINGSMVAYLGALFTVAAVITMTNTFSLLLYLTNMVVMLIALQIVSAQFGLALEIQTINLVSFTLIALVLSRVLFFHNLQDFENRLLIEKQRQELEELATKDPLTSALNRRKFLDLLNLEKERAIRYDRPFSLMLFDLDHFKSVNDRYGHPAGDRVLVEVARLVRRNLRKTDIFARWGGEEFIIFSPETNFDGIQVLAEKIRRLIAHHKPSGAPAVTASFGVADYAPGEAIEGLIKRADNALYRAKNSGRNRVRAIAAGTAEAVDRERIRAAGS